MTHVNTTDFIRALINARHPDSAPLVPEKIRTATVMPSSYGYPIQFSLVLGSYGVYLKLMIEESVFDPFVFPEQAFPSEAEPFDYPVARFVFGCSLDKYPMQS